MAAFARRWASLISERRTFRLTIATTIGRIDFVTTVSKDKLKADMLRYFREVETTGEPLMVTDQGREVLEVRPVKKRGDAEETPEERRIRSRERTLQVLREYAAAGPSELPSAEELMKPERWDDW